MVGNISVTILTLSVLAAGGCTAVQPPLEHHGLATASGSGAQASASVPPQSCSETHFVACKSSAACATRAGKLIEPQTCFVHAADACTSLACEHGCDIHHGAIDEPKMVHCGLDAQSTSNMQRCGGYSGWGCPEQMTCQPTDPTEFDAEGVCVPRG